MEALDGVVKFQCEWIHSGPLIFGGLSELIKWRQIFFENGLVGYGADGVAFGNLSMRFLETDNFIITGSQTSGIKEVDGRHFTKVIDVDINANIVKCVGPVTASSETMTHGAFYKASKDINAVVHIHKADAWEKLVRLLPKTSDEAQYGTPALANEIIKLYGQKGAPSSGLFIMSGHKDGIIAFGNTISEAALIIAKYTLPHLYKKLSKL